jgi:hypothetical protein
MDAEYVSNPAPHVYVRQLVDPALYRQARFPELERPPGGRIGRDLYPSDPEFAGIVRTNGWEPIYTLLTSEGFVRHVLGFFADDLLARGCPVTADNWHLDPHFETRKETESRDLGLSEPATALFTRFDFQAAGRGYVKPPHVDWPRRIVGGVIFCCDAQEEGLEGGEFGFYTDDDPDSPPRVCRKPACKRTYVPRHNTAVFFLNGNDGFHGPTPITRLSGQRRWIYYSISSRRDVWT